jgi:hypothetical protein
MEAILMIMAEPQITTEQNSDHARYTYDYGRGGATTVIIRTSSGAPAAPAYTRRVLERAVMDIGKFRVNGYEEDGLSQALNETMKNRETAPG